MFLPKTLTLTSIFCVNNISPDDGHSVTYAYFTTRDLAKTYLQKHHKITGSVVEKSVYVDEFKQYYEVPKYHISVDMPTKEEVLDKLTDKEKKVLGL